MNIGTKYRVAEIDEIEEELQPQIQKAFADAGKDPSGYIAVYDSETGALEFRPKTKDAGTVQTLATQAGLNVLPAAIGMVGMGAGSMLGAVKGLAGGPAAPATSVIGAISGALVGGFGTAILQDKLLDKFLPEVAKKSAVQRHQSPTTSTAGGIIGGFPVGVNTFKHLLNIARPLAERTGKSVLSTAAKIAAPAAALSGGLEAGQELFFEGEVSPARVGLATAAGPFMVRDTGLGRGLRNIGERTAERVGRLAQAPQLPAAPPPSNIPVYEEIMALHNANITDPEQYRPLAARLNVPEATVDRLVAVAETSLEGRKLADPDAREMLAKKVWKVASEGGDLGMLPKSKLAKILVDEVKSGYADEQDLIRIARSERPELRAQELRVVNVERNLAAQKDFENLVATSEEWRPERIEATTREVISELRAVDTQVRTARKAKAAWANDTDVVKKQQIDAALADALERQKAVLGRMGDEFEGADLQKDYDSIIARYTKKQEKKLKQVRESKAPVEGVVKPGEVPAEQPPVLDNTKAALAQAVRAAGEPGGPMLPKSDAQQIAEIAPPDVARQEAMKEAAVVRPVAAVKPKPAQKSQPAPPAETYEQRWTATDRKQQTHLKRNAMVVAQLPEGGNAVGSVDTWNPDTGEYTVKVGERKIRNVPKNSVALVPEEQLMAARTAEKQRTDKPTAFEASVEQAGVEREIAEVARGPQVVKPAEVFTIGDTVHGQRSDGTIDIGRVKGIRGDGALILDIDAGVVTYPKELVRKVSDNEVRNFGLPRDILKTVHDGWKWLHTKVFEGTVEQIRALGKSGAELADVDFALHRYAQRVTNVAWQKYNAALKGLSKTERARVSQYMNDMQDMGISLVEPTPKELKAIGEIRQGLDFLADEQIIIDGPYIDGERVRFKNPKYFPSVPDVKVIRHMRGAKENDELARRLADEWRGWYVEKLGITAKEAEDMMQNYLTVTKTLNASDAAYGAVRRAEGVGLPRGWRADIEHTLYSHAWKASKDLSWFKHIQQNPRLAKILNVPDDGKGGTWNFDDPSLDVVNLSSNPVVQAWMGDINSHKMYNQQSWDNLSQLSNAGRIGFKSAVRDLLSTPWHMMELVGVSEAPLIAKALANAIQPGAKARAEAAGAMRAYRMANFETTADAFTGAIGRMSETLRKYQGRNAIEALTRQWTFEAGMLVSDARLREGDGRFFDALGVKGWREMSPEVLREEVGARFVDRFQGNYRASGLPPWLLAGSDHAMLRSMFSLARWSVERYNNWRQLAWEPAVKRGEFGGLIRSILGPLAGSAVVDYVRKELFNEKPPEMTWEEFFQTEGDKEVAYTVFSKLQYLGFAGVLSDLLFSGIRGAKGELPNWWEWPAESMFTSLAQRTYQAAQAVGNQGVGGLDVLIDYMKAVLTDNIQMMKIANKWMKEDKGQREERMYRRQVLGEVQSAGSLVANPLEAHRPLRDASTPEEVLRAMLRSVNAVLATQRMPQLQGQSRTLEPSKIGAPDFYTWLAQVQGPAAAAERLAADLQQDELTEGKRALLQQSLLSRLGQ